MNHYGRVYLALVLFCLGGVVSAAGALFALLDSGAELDRWRSRSAEAWARATEARTQLGLQESRMPPVRAFLAAWDLHARKGADERELGLQIRSGLEALAQQRLGLVTDLATTPEPARVLAGGRSWRVQSVRLRASGESLEALVAWLGAAEEMFPYARVDGWELAGAGGANCTLRVVFSQPLAAASGDRKGGVER